MSFCTIEDVENELNAEDIQTGDVISFNFFPLETGNSVSTEGTYREFKHASESNPDECSGIHFMSRNFYRHDRIEKGSIQKVQ